MVWPVPARTLLGNVQAQVRIWHSPGTLPKCNMDKATCSMCEQSSAVWLQAVAYHLLLELENHLWPILFTDRDTVKLICAESA